MNTPTTAPVSGVVPDLPQTGFLFGWRLIAFLGLMVAASAAGLVVGGEFGQFLQASLMAVPFMTMALLAYVGQEGCAGRGLTLAWMGFVFVAVLFIYTMGTLDALHDPAAPAAALGALQAGGSRVLWHMAGLMILGLAAGGACWLPNVRRGLARLLPLDPTSFLHAVALSTAVTLTLVSVAPLLALGRPPMLASIANANRAGVTSPLTQEGSSYTALYDLIWALVCAPFLVGFGRVRTLRQALSRLGLIAPTWRQAMIGVGCGLAMVGLGIIIDWGTGWLWRTFGWAQTEGDLVKQLMGAATTTPLSALIYAVDAGLGEETLIRGALQPRLGVVLTSALFTSAHAFQYNWDALLWVMIAGVTMGLIRRRFNTTTSAIVHFFFDFMLFLGEVWHLPGLS